MISDLSLQVPLVGDDRPHPGPACAVRDAIEEDRPAQGVVRVGADGSAVFAEHPRDLLGRECDVDARVLEVLDQLFRLVLGLLPTAGPT